jgi:hypothetical protein
MWDHMERNTSVLIWFGYGATVQPRVCRKWSLGSGWTPSDWLPFRFSFLTPFGICLCLCHPEIFLWSTISSKPQDWIAENFIHFILKISLAESNNAVLPRSNKTWNIWLSLDGTLGPLSGYVFDFLLWSPQVSESYPQRSYGLFSSHQSPSQVDQQGPNGPVRLPSGPVKMKLAKLRAKWAAGVADMG